ncbi:carbon-nitrogen hydrolase family protein [Sporobolomyces salmoneus]|uniref:carbon-nitrogen hydrolase family protein n=1 Tax=Sporobolomyces salmoneus TaxID=183962 RepID=UPI00317159F2
MLSRLSTSLRPSPRSARNMTISAAPVNGRNFRLAMCQIAQPGDGSNKQDNLAHARDMVSKAIQGGAEGKRPDLVTLPEIFNSPYATNMFRKYAERINWTQENKESYDVAESESESIKLLSGIAKEHKIWLIGGSIPELTPDDKVYNTAPVFSPDGKLVALHRKVHLFDIDMSAVGGIVFKESDTLTGGDQVTIVETDFGKIGVGVCYDVRYPELAMIAARKGAIAMLYPSAFNLTTGPLHWDLLQRARAVDQQIYVGMCSPARATSGDGYKAWGFSGVSDPMGKFVTQLDEKEGIAFADIDMSVIDKARAGIPVTVQRRFDVYDDVSKTA